jgi:hypothetical protein
MAFEVLAQHDVQLGFWRFIGRAGADGKQTEEAETHVDSVHGFSVFRGKTFKSKKRCNILATHPSAEIFVEDKNRKRWKHKAITSFLRLKSHAKCFLSIRAAFFDAFVELLLSKVIVFRRPGFLSD